MEDWVIAVVVILALLMAGISLLVGYLLYRNRRGEGPGKTRMSPDGYVATKYADPPENGDVKLTMPDDGNSTLPPYSSKGSSLNGKPKETKVDVESSDSDKESTPEDKGLLKEVKVVPQERPVDVGYLGKEAPEMKDDAAASSTSSDSDKEKKDVVKESPAKHGDSDEDTSPKKTKYPGESSTSSTSSSDSDVDSVKPMPLIEPKIVRDEEKTPENDDDDLVSDVLAAVDGKKQGTSSSSSSDSDKRPTPKARAHKPTEVKERSSTSSTSETDHESGDDVATQTAMLPPRRKRSKKKKRKSPKTKPRTIGSTQTQGKDSSSLSSSDEDVKRIEPIYATPHKKSPDRESSSSSSSSDELIVPATTRPVVFTSGWKRPVLLTDMIAAGVVPKKSLDRHEKGDLPHKEFEKSLKPYLVGEEPVGGILVSETGEKMSIQSAYNKEYLRRGTCLSLLEAQAATGRILDPKTGVRYSVREASKAGVIDARFETELKRSERAVYGYTDRRSSELYSPYQAMKRGHISEVHGMRVLDAQLATGGIIDPNTNHRIPVEVAYKRGMLDEKTNEILRNPSEDSRQFMDPNTKEKLSYLELMNKCVTDSDTGMRLYPLQTKVKKSSSSSSSDENEKQMEKDMPIYAIPGEGTKLLTEKSPERKMSSSSDDDGIATIAKRPVVFMSGWKRPVLLSDLIAAGVVPKKSVKDHEKGKLPYEDFEESLSPYLVGAEPVGGILLLETGENISIQKACNKGYLNRETCLPLLEAQAATGRILDPKTGVRYSVAEASKTGLIDTQLEKDLTSAEKAVCGYTTRSSPEILSPYQAMKHGHISEDNGMLALDAQISTGGIIDPKTNHRLPVEVAYKRGLLDEKTNEILQNPTDKSRRFLDPNTKEKLSYSELMKRCVTDSNTGMRMYPLRMKVVTSSSSSSSDESDKRMDVDAPIYAKPHKTTEMMAARSPDRESSSSSSSDDETIAPFAKRPVVFTSGWKRPVLLTDLIAAGIVPEKALDEHEKGKISYKELEIRLKPYLLGAEPVGGILLSETGEKMTVQSAYDKGYLSDDTCMPLLEAQAASGRILDPKTGVRYSVEEASKADLIDAKFEKELRRTERSVYGYTTPSSTEILSPYQAMKRGHISERHGMRVLDVQVATGGVIDPKTNHRLPTEVACKRGLLDEETYKILQFPSDKSRGFLDPNTKEKLSYSELMNRCVTDSDTGMRLFPLQTKPITAVTTPKFGVPMTTQTEKTPSSSSTSSSSSSEAEMDLSITRGEISTQTDAIPTTRKKKRKVPRPRRILPTVEREESLNRSSIPSSESEREMYRYAASATPRYGPRPWSPPPRSDGAVSPSSDRYTQTLVAPKTKTPKRTKSKEPMQISQPIVVTMVEQNTQTMKMSSSSSSSSSSSEDLKPTEPKVLHVYEKGVQKTPPPSSSSSSSEEEMVVEEKVVHVYEKGIQKTPPPPSSSSDSERKITKTVFHTQRDVAVSSVDQRFVSTDKQDIVTSEAHFDQQHEFEPVTLDLGPGDVYKAETVVKLPPAPKKIFFVTSWGKQVHLDSLYDAGIVDETTKIRLESGELEPSDEVVVTMVAPYVTSNRPVAGILLTETGDKISIAEAAKKGLIKRNTALNMLEAQAATGNIIDPYTGKQMTVDEAKDAGFVDSGYESTLAKAARAVHGYQTIERGKVLSVFEAMNKEIISQSHGMRLLEAQLATGGIIDPKASHRLPLQAAYQRKLLDQHTMNKLNAGGEESRGFVDPNTNKNLTYQEFVSLCVTDVKTGALLFPLAPQERGRSPKTSTSIVSSTRLDVKSPSRSKSRERTEVFTLPKTSASSSSSSDESKRKRKAKEIKTSSANIKLTKTPVMSADDDDQYEMKKVTLKKESSDEEKKRIKITEEIITTTERLPTEEAPSRDVAMKSITVEEYQKFSPVQVDVKMKEVESKEKSSSSSSNEEDQKMVVTTTKDVKTIEDEGSSTFSQTTTTTVVTTTTEIVTAKRRKSRQDIKFKSGWNRQASLLDLFAAGVVTKETVQELEEGTIMEEDVERNLQQYLVGADPIAGILLSDTGEKISIYAAWRKGLIRRGTSISLLEAQAATGRILDPKSGKRFSVEEASREGLIDRQFEAVLVRAERAVYGYTTRASKEVFSLFQAMKRGLVVENHGIRLLEAQIATGGIIDPNANHRLPVEIAYERGLFDKRMNEILEDPSDDTRGFFDPNTEENLTYLELMERCITDKDTGMLLLPLRTARASTTPKKSKVVFESRTGRQVTLADLVNAQRVDTSTAKRVEEGTMQKEEMETMVAKLRVFVDGTMPIAGVINTDTGERISIYEAAKTGLIRRGTAFELLEAQACCGKVIDVQTGRVITIETAIGSGVIDREFKDVVERAHRAVTGYREPFKRELLSLCEAMNRHIVVRRHGIRLLEAQIATGGIFDIKSPVRISPQVALKRALVDANLANQLEQKTTQSYFDPVTGENLNYSELMGRCVTDKDTGLLYLMVEGGTVTGYIRPFEPEHTSKIRTQSASPGRIETEEVTTTRSASSYSSSTVLETSGKKERVKKKKRSKRAVTSTSSASSTGGESTGASTPPSPSLISRKIIIVDPDTNEEIDVREALKRKLIDKDTARQLIAQQGEFPDESS